MGSCPCDRPVHRESDSYPPPASGQVHLLDAENIWQVGQEPVQALPEVLHQHLDLNVLPGQHSWGGSLRPWPSLILSAFVLADPCLITQS